MTNGFRIDASEMRTWHAALVARMDVRGVAAIAKEVEVHLARQEADGTIPVARHQLFTWAEALQGAASRDPHGSSAGAQLSLAQVVADMRSVLTGKTVPPAAPDVAPPVRMVPPAPASLSPPPPITYGAPVVATTTQGARVLSGADLGATVRELIRSARSELYVCSPWPTGIETLVPDVVALPADVRVLVLSRRPDRDDAAFHAALDQLGRRRAVTAWSPHLQTRLVIQDGERAIVGAASIPGPASREMGVLVTDRALVSTLRAQFEARHQEAAGGKY